MEAERARLVNHNYKIFQEAVSAALDQPDEAVFNPSIDNEWFVKDAKLSNKIGDLFRKICKRLNEGRD